MIYLHDNYIVIFLTIAKIMLAHFCVSKYNEINYFYLFFKRNPHMKEENILLRIEEKLPSMTKSQLKIANEVLQNPTILLFSSVEQLAQQLEVSTATIVRFANLFGFHGYAELQNQFRIYYQQFTEPEVRFNANLSSQSAEQNMLYDAYLLQMKILEGYYTKDLELKLQKATELLSNAPHIYTAGSRAGFSIAYYLGHHLNRIFKNCDIIESNDRITDILVRIQPDDVVFIANQPRYTKAMYELARAAKAASAKLIVICDTFLSPYSKLADVLFAVPNQSSDFHNSMIPSMMTVELLITSMMLNNNDHVQKSLPKLNLLFEQFEVFK